MRSIQRDEKKSPGLIPSGSRSGKSLAKRSRVWLLRAFPEALKMVTQKMLRFLLVVSLKTGNHQTFFQGMGGFEESKNVKEKHQNPLIRTGSVECKKQWTYLQITRKIEEPSVCKETPHESPTFFHFRTKNQVSKIKSRILEKRPEEKNIPL